MPSQSRHGYGSEFHHKLQTQPSHTTQYAYCQQQCRTKVELRSNQGRIILTHRCPCTHANNDSNTANLQTTSLRSDGHFVCEHVPSLAEPSERRCTSCPQCNRLPPIVTLHIVHVPICDRRPAPAEVMPSGTIERHETHHLHSRGGTWLSDAEGPLGSHDGFQGHVHPQQLGLVLFGREGRNCASLLPRSQLPCWQICILPCARLRRHLCCNLGPAGHGHQENKP
jgi:hypothetical protein